MNQVELDDGPGALQAKETELAMPVGMKVLYGVLVLWGIWYLFSYFGWDQAGEVQGAAATAVGTNIGSTIFFTAAAATAAVVLAVMMARKARGGSGK